MARNAQFYFKPITFLLCAALELKREINCRTWFLLDILANPPPWSMLHTSPLRAPQTSMGIGLVVCWFSTTRSRRELRGHTHFRKKTRLLRDLEVQQIFETWLVGSTGDLFAVLRMYSMATVFALQSLTQEGRHKDLWWCRQLNWMRWSCNIDH